MLVPFWDMEGTKPKYKRPRIEPKREVSVRDFYAGMPFERAVNKAIEDGMDARIMLAGLVLELDPNRDKDKSYLSQRWDLAHEMDAMSLAKVLRMRLRDRGIELED